jgi:hypothetical protein
MRSLFESDGIFTAGMDDQMSQGFTVTEHHGVFTEILMTSLNLSILYLQRR